MLFRPGSSEKRAMLRNQKDKIDGPYMQVIKRKGRRQKVVASKSSMLSLFLLTLTQSVNCNVENLIAAVSNRKAHSW